MGAGFSSEIETYPCKASRVLSSDVAWGLASRLRLKLTAHWRALYSLRGRMGAGFSSEIETWFEVCPVRDLAHVAWGLASRLRLKLETHRPRES